MKLKNYLEIVNDPVIIYREANLGELSKFDTRTYKSALEMQVLFIEGLPNKKVVIYLGD